MPSGKRKKIFPFLSYAILNKELLLTHEVLPALKSIAGWVCSGMGHILGKHFEQNLD